MKSRNCIVEHVLKNFLKVIKIYIMKSFDIFKFLVIFYYFSKLEIFYKAIEEY